ncbi:hypothetical protein Droror1_Dr00024602, partial [Drosera rotundifolia]
DRIAPSMFEFMWSGHFEFMFSSAQSVSLIHRAQFIFLTTTPNPRPIHLSHGHRNTTAPHPLCPHSLHRRLASSCLCCQAISCSKWYSFFG